MRFAFVSFVFALVAVAGAQQTIAPRTPSPGTVAPRPASPGFPAPAVTPQRPTASSPTRHGSTTPRTPHGPPILVPFSPLMPPVAGGLTPPVPFRTNDLMRPPRDLYRARPGNPFRPQLYPFVGGYGDGYAGSGYAMPEYGTPGYQSTEQPSPAPAFGTLRLNVNPSSAQVFVDAYYAGTIADIEDRGVVLVAGPHRVELRAQHYEPATFDVRIAPNDTIVYRASLDPRRPPVPAAPCPPGTRMYVIPGCYAGNVPPRADRLPAGCNIKLVRVLEGPTNQ